MIPFPCWFLFTRPLCVSLTHTGPACVPRFLFLAFSPPVLYVSIPTPHFHSIRVLLPLVEILSLLPLLELSDAVDVAVAAPVTSSAAADATNAKAAAAATAVADLVPPAVVEFMCVSIVACVNTVRIYYLLLSRLLLL